MLEGGNAPERMPDEIALRRAILREDVNRRKLIFDAFFNQTEPDNPDIDAVVCAEDTRVFGHLMRPPRLVLSAPKSPRPSAPDH